MEIAAMVTASETATADQARFLTWRERWGGAVARLAGASEHDPDRRRDLEQEIWLGLWRALPQFEGRCSDRTFVFRVAHNVAATAALQGARDWLKRAAPLEEVVLDDGADVEGALDRHQQLARLHALIGKLLPLDRQVVLLWLEGLPATDIAEVTGLSASNVAVKIHRLKAVLLKANAAEEAP